MRVITFEVIKRLERLFNVWKRHYFAQDTSVRHIEHRWETIRKMIQPPRCNGRLDSESIAAIAVVISESLSQSSIDEYERDIHERALQFLVMNWTSC